MTRRDRVLARLAGFPLWLMLLASIAICLACVFVGAALGKP